MLSFRDALQTDIRCLPANHTAAQKADILQKQQKLHTRMAKFNQTAQLFMSDLDINVTFSHQDDPAFCFEEEGENMDAEDIHEDAEEDGYGDNPDESFAEDPTLWMPSYIGASCVNNAGFRGLVKEEVQLRIGQANDSLEKLRTHLGHKAILYRMNFRSSTSVRTDTRSKQDIRRVSLKINRDVRSYHRARESLSRLEASQEILQKYQHIKHEELKVTKDITEENRFGQGSYILPWFWRIGGNQLGPTDIWNDECKYHSLSSEFSLDIHTSNLKFIELAG
jgi:hypothetical protein